jgi:hypothetical protein
MAYSNKRSSLLVYRINNTRKMFYNKWPFSKHFIFFATYNRAQQARLLSRSPLQAFPFFNNLDYWAHS